ncbi:MULTISPECIES: sensor histidine kinase [unclassified Curtobacterium]|uniref:sensor histidine kinase n=1 Tax=unclassified Curtobacterium TaxID=257496 RepID=UPI0008DD0578|nr:MULTISPECIES: histidine kinase [unclassified Curtobacterium]OIH92997.1 two-component sensor histidine kinase [Curtobacterium sp. MCBA15_003]OII29910.1 two-component sensor histidine kinase [Curtobacterium sp. MMLR14_006]
MADRQSTPASTDSGSAGSSRTATAGVRRVLARVGARTADNRDVALAVASAVVTVALLGLLRAADLLLGTARTGTDTQVAAVVVLAVVQCAPLVVRRRRPVATLLTVAVVQAALLAAVPTGVALWGVAPVVAAATVGAARPPAAAVRAIVAAVGIAAVGAVVGATGTVTALLGAAPRSDPLTLVLGAVAVVLTAVVVNGASAAVGSWTALRRAHARAAEERAAEAVEHQVTRTRAAVAAERTRMARELHDVAAHHLTGLVVQAGAAERLVDVDPERAKDSVRSIREQGRETLQALRAIVGILRETGDDATGTAPVPGLADVGDLVDAARASGQVVVARIDGTLPDLAPLADVTAYRTVQEALVNARRHTAGAPALLGVSADADRVTITVENDLGPSEAPAGPPGHGLVGMRERATLVGGRLRAGPVAGGRWRVRLDLDTRSTT